MGSYKTYKACYKTDEGGCGSGNRKDRQQKGFNVLLSEAKANQQVKDQKQRRREILLAASNKLRNELSLGVLSKGCTRWLKSTDKYANEVYKLKQHQVATCLADLEEDDLLTNDVNSPSPTITDTSDYTMSSVSMDGQSPREQNFDFHSGSSFNGGLGQWDLVENAGCSLALLMGDFVPDNGVDKHLVSPTLSAWKQALQLTPSQDQCHSPPKDDVITTTGRLAPEEQLMSSQVFCSIGHEIQYDDAREDFDIVYDLFYQDENFEPSEVFMVSEELQDALKEDCCKVHNNRTQQADETRRLATPPLERVESPEFCTRSAVKSLPGVTACKFTKEGDATSLSCHGLATAQAGGSVFDTSCEDEFLSFSRRDFSVLRRSLQELQVCLICQKNSDEFFCNEADEEIQEDLALTSAAEKEEVSMVRGLKQQINGTTSSFVGCQEMMMTQQERKVTPLSAARVLRPLSNSVVVHGFQQSPVDDDVRESCCKWSKESAVIATPNTIPQGAQKRDNSLQDDSKLVHHERKKVKCAVPERNAILHLFSQGRSNGSSRASSYATPRTGISADELETSVSRNNVPSRCDFHDDTAEGSILEMLSAKVQLLDVNQQKYLLQVLNKIERAKQSGNLNIPSMFASLERPWMGGVLLTSPAEVEGAPKTHHLLVLRILSTWGDTKCVGLVEVSLAQAPELKFLIAAYNAEERGCRA